MNDDTPWTLRPGDIIVSSGRAVLVIGAPHTNADDPDPSRRHLVVCRVSFRTTGETGPMTFAPSASVPRSRFDPVRVRLEVSAPDGCEGGVTAYDCDRRIGEVRWWEVNTSVSVIRPPYQGDPLHRLLVERAREVCPTLDGPNPVMPLSDDPHGRLAAREEFLNVHDRVGRILGANYLTVGTAHRVGELPDEHAAAFREAWLRHGERLYVVGSHDCATDVTTPIAWAGPGDPLHIPQVHYDEIADAHQQLVREVAQREEFL